MRFIFESASLIKAKHEGYYPIRFIPESGPGQFAQVEFELRGTAIAASEPKPNPKVDSHLEDFIQEWIACLSAQDASLLENLYVPLIVDNTQTTSINCMNPDLFEIYSIIKEKCLPLQSHSVANQVYNAQLQNLNRSYSCIQTNMQTVTPLNFLAQNLVCSYALGIDKSSMYFDIDSRNSFFAVYQTYITIPRAKQIARIFQQYPEMCQLKICGSTLENNALSILFNSFSSNAPTTFTFCHNQFSSANGMKELSQTLDKNKSIVEYSGLLNKASDVGELLINASDAAIAVNSDATVCTMMIKKESEFWQNIILNLHRNGFNKAMVSLVSQYYSDKGAEIFDNTLYDMLMSFSFPGIDKELLDRLSLNDPTLTKLSLNKNSLKNHDVVGLCQALEKNMSLTYLNLMTNDIGDRAAIALAKLLTDNPTLTYLDLRENRIRDAGAEALRVSLDLRKVPLEVLTIRTNKISMPGLILLSDVMLRRTKTAEYFFKLICDDEDELVTQPLSYTSKELMNLLLTDPRSLLKIPDHYPVDVTSLYMKIQQFDLIAECECNISTNRANQFDYRKEIENLFLKQFANNTKNEVFNFVSVGSASLFQEMVIIAKLIQAGFKNLHISLIDSLYANVQLLTNGKASSFILLTHVISLLQTLGCQVIDGADPKNNHLPYNPLIFQKFGFERYRQMIAKMTKEQSQKSEVESLQSGTAKPSVTIHVFDSIKAYIDSMQKGMQNPNAVLVIDLDQPFEQEAIVKPLLDAVNDGTTYFTSYLSWLDHHHRDRANIEVSQKTNGQWVPLFNKDKYHLPVNPHNQFELLTSSLTSNMGNPMGHPVVNQVISSDVQAPEDGVDYKL